MSHNHMGSLLSRLARTRSSKSFAKHFLLSTMAGQKMFLHNEQLPRVVNISFNEHTCMFSCRMCPYAEKHVREHYRGGSEMRFETLRAIVESIPDDPHYSFDISAIGETLSFRKLAEFVTYMKRTRPLVNTVVSTNGVLLTADAFRKLAASGLDTLQISLFAQNARDHKTITGTDSFRRVADNIETAARIKREEELPGPFLQTFMIECRETAQHTDAFLAHWSRHVDKAFIRPMYNVGREIEGMTPTFEQTPDTDRYPCITPWYSTAIRSTGEVLHCYAFHWHDGAWDEALGNINDAPLRDLWRSEPFRRFREAHLRLDFEQWPVCAKCNAWDAYTDIWRRTTDGFSRAPLTLADLFTPAPGHRGG